MDLCPTCLASLFIRVGKAMLAVVLCLFTVVVVVSLSKGRNPPVRTDDDSVLEPLRWQQHQKPQPKPTVLRGKCWVIDGDTIMIGQDNIRLAGIDAPELDHPYGKNAKWAMMQLCSGKIIEAHVTGEISHNRVVAVCKLPDGRDLAAEIVKQGLAIDWPKYSGGRYRQFEHTNARRKLWRADARQKGRMPSPAGARYEERL